MATNPKRKDAKGTEKVLKKKSGSKASSRLEEEDERKLNSAQISDRSGGEERRGGRGGGGGGGEEERGRGQGRGGGGRRRGGGGQEAPAAPAPAPAAPAAPATPPAPAAPAPAPAAPAPAAPAPAAPAAPAPAALAAPAPAPPAPAAPAPPAPAPAAPAPAAGEVEAGHGLWSIIVYCTILIAVVLGVILASVVIPEELKGAERYEENAKFNYVKIFDNKLKEMKTHFPNQTTRFWKILQTRGLGHLNDKQPKQPLVILMGAPPSAHNIIDCLAWKLAKALDPGNYDLGHIDGSRFSSYGGHEAKKIMDEKLEKLFQKGDRCALILHLELLPPPSPILFYSYCDNDNAPFKHAGIIFTVHLPEEPDLSLSPVEQEGMIEKYLSDVAWSKYPYEHDSVSALLSRIADTVALVSGETEEVVQSHCSNQ